MKIRRITQTVVASVCAVALSVSTAGTANATQSADSSSANVQQVEATLEQVAVNNDSLIVESSVLPHESIVSISLGSGQVTIPEDLSEGVTRDSPGPSSITVTPDPSVDWEEAIPLNTGGVTYLSDDGFFGKRNCWRRWRADADNH